MEPGEDEELPGSDRPPLSRRTRLALAWSTGVAVVVAGVVTVVSVDTTHAEPRADATPAPTTTSPVPTPEPTPVLSVPTTTPTELACIDIGSSGLNCVASTFVPAAFLRAVRTVLPGAEVRATATVVGRSGAVFSRQVSVRASGGRTLTVHIGPPNGQYSVITVPGTTDPASLQLDIDARSHHVTVTYRNADGGRLPSVATLRRLAEDRRLIAL